MATIQQARPEKRIPSLDVVRGIAVMGILAMNIAAFAMPFPAYFNAFAFGWESSLDSAAYAFNFILVDGKMRGLFSLLFGASMLLVAQRAEAGGESAAGVTYRRLFWLLVIGMIHFYLVWFGDILVGYALAGMVAFLFRHLGVRALIGWGAALLLLQLTIMAVSAFHAHSLGAAAASPGATVETLKEWHALSRDFAVPTTTTLQETLALHLGPWSGIVAAQTGKHLFDPLIYSLLFGPETLAYMLFGMAGLKSGFLTAQWSERRYERIAFVGLAVALPIYAFICVMLFIDGFSVAGIFTWHMAATIPVRPLMVIAYAALIIELARGGGPLAGRIAAAGRAAFTNYLGTSIVMTGIFYGWGLGLFGTLSRAELWLPVLGMWALMLLWSKPWLDRYWYGPLEWLWRSLARGRPQPMRR